MADRTGRCVCGAVTYTATLKSDDIGVCHCGLCRRSSAGPFMAVDASAITFADGAPVTRYASSEWASRCFCATCGTSLAWISNDGKIIEIAAYTLDELPSGRLTTEIFVDDKPSHYDFAGDTQKLTGAEVIAMAQGG